MGRWVACEIAFRRPGEERELNGNQRFGRYSDILAHFEQFPPLAEITDNDTDNAQQCKGTRCSLAAHCEPSAPEAPRLPHRSLYMPVLSASVK